MQGPTPPTIKDLENDARSTDEYSKIPDRLQAKMYTYDRQHNFALWREFQHYVRYADDQRDSASVVLDTTKQTTLDIANAAIKTRCEKWAALSFIDQTFIDALATERPVISSTSAAGSGASDTSAARSGATDTSAARLGGPAAILTPTSQVAAAPFQPKACPFSDVRLSQAAPAAAAVSTPMGKGAGTGKTPAKKQWVVLTPAREQPPWLMPSYVFARALTRAHAAV